MIRLALITLVAIVGTHRRAGASRDHARRFRQGADRHLGILQRRPRQDLHRHVQERPGTKSASRSSSTPIAANQFPLVNDVAGWNFPEGDLLRLLDAQGRTLVEFSEVEDGIYEAPTPGLGVLFLQSPAAAGPPPKSPEEVAGNWAITRGTGAPACALTLATTVLRDAFVLTVKPGCDPRSCGSVSSNGAWIAASWSWCRRAALPGGSSRSKTAPGTGCRKAPIRSRWCGRTLSNQAAAP